MQAGCFPNRWVGACSTADEIVIYRVLFISLEWACEKQQAQGAAELGAHPCGTGDDAQQQGLAQGRTLKQQDLLGQLQEINHPNCTATKDLALRIKLWLPHQLLDQTFLFLLQQHKTEASQNTGGDGQQLQMRIWACSNPSLTSVYHKPHSDQLMANLKTVVTICATTLNYVLHWQSLGEKARNVAVSKRISLKCGENQACKGEGANRAATKIQDEWEATSFWELQRATVFYLWNIRILLCIITLMRI